MKKNIHPELLECKVICACGYEFMTQSTKSAIHVEVCSKCHPFYTGEQSVSKRKGNIEKFNAKWNLSQDEKNTEKAA